MAQIKFSRGVSLWFVACVSCLSACGPHGPSEGASIVQHDNDQPVRGTDAWMWHSVTRAEYASTMTPLIGVEASQILAPDHTLVKRTQLWLDQIDAQIRGEHGARLANVPKPTAQVVKEASPNAFVAPVPVCYKAAVKVRSGTPTSASTADRVYLDLSTGELSAFPAQYGCVEGAAAVTTLKQVAQRFNQYSPGCKLSVGSDDKLAVNAACPVANDLQGIVAGKAVVLLETANYVTVHTGLFPIMTEEAFVAVLAHELGHYYRSHMTAQESEYDFFYTLNRNQPDHRPVAEPARQELGEGAIASATLLTATDTHVSYPGQKIRSELFFATGSLIKGVCAAGSCSAACSTAKTLIDSQAFKTKIGRFPFGSSSPSQGEAVTQFESKALACLATVAVESDPDTLTASAASWDVVKGFVTSPSWPSWLGTLPASTLKALARVVALDALRLGDAAPHGADFKAALANAGRTLAEQDDTAIDTLKTAQSEKLGQYTAEQEADEQAAEWIAAIGLAPKASVEAMAALGKGGATRLRGFHLGQSDCDRLWENDWLDENGAYYFVPVGDYSESHHSTCYRMFNLEREIAAHDHAAADVDHPSTGGAAWASLQDTADSLGGTPPSEGGGLSGLRLDSKVAPLARKGNMATCSYASEYW